MELDPRIRIRAPLRCDGIGRLDCAEDADSGARLAVRWLPLDANGVAAVKACEKLPTNPALPRIRQTGQVGASAFVALDFPQGELLSAREGERLANEVLLRVAGQLADALATVHAQGVVHGEMSADSVLLANGHAYLWDMPLVIANRLSDRRGENRLMQNLVKTAAFLSPERARGEGASQAGDVYALGVVLCAAAGAPLPTGATTLGTVHQVATGAWAPRVPGQLPDAWREMLTCMLATEPAHRPTAAEVARAFSEAPSHTALPTVPEMPVVRLPEELLAVAAQKAKAVAEDELQRAKTREMPLVELQAITHTAGAVATSALQLEAAPAPTTDVATARETHDPYADVPEADADVVRIPTLEIRAVEAPPALVAAQAPVVEATSVALTDSVSVAPELAASAVTISAEEVSALHSGRAQVGVLVAGLALALLGVAMVLVVLFVGTTPRPAPVPVTPAVVAPAPEPAPMPTPVAEALGDEELVPLLKLAPVKKAAAKAPPAPRAVAKEAAPAPLVDVTPEPVEAAPVVEPSPAPAPKAELKRPEL